MPAGRPDFPNLVVFDHPLIHHKLAHLRDQRTGHRPFRALVGQIAGLMVYEVTREFPTAEAPVETPLESTTGVRMAKPVTVVPVLRAGLEMCTGILEIMPEARVGHIGLFRDEKTLQPTQYLSKLPHDIGDGPVLLVDPMLATGGTAEAAVRMLSNAGARDIRLLCLIASPEGVRRLSDSNADMLIYAAALDRQLNERGFILPGIGDAGDRLYGT